MESHFRYPLRLVKLMIALAVHTEKLLTLKVRTLTTAKTTQTAHIEYCEVQKILLSTLLIYVLSLIDS